MRENRIDTLQAEVHARRIKHFANNTRKVTHLNACCFYSNMADNHCFFEVRETSSLAMNVMRSRSRYCWYFQGPDSSVHYTVVDLIVAGSEIRAYARYVGADKFFITFLTPRRQDGLLRLQFLTPSIACLIWLILNKLRFFNFIK